MLMRKVFGLVLSLVVVQAYGVLPVIMVGDVGDVDCDYVDLQTAIDDVVDDTEIRVSRDSIGSEKFGLVVINDKPIVLLQGGYDSCAIDAIVTKQSIISNDAGDGLALYFASNHVIEVAGFDIKDNLKKGMVVKVSSNLVEFTANIHHVNIFNNTKVGMEFTGQSNSIFLDNVDVYNNQNIVGGSTQGGGIRCVDAQVTVQENTAIHDNVSDLGAGIYSSKCLIILHAGEYNPDGSIKYGIFNNTANSYGAGMYVSNGTVFAFGKKTHPVIISNNSALSDTLGWGGAIAMFSGADITLTNTVMDNNVATFRGGAVYGDSFDTNLSPARLTTYRDPLGCDYAEICSSISGNQVLSGNSGRGGAIYLRRNAKADINQTLIKGNVAGISSVAHVSYSDTSLKLEGNLITGNKAADDTSAFVQTALFYSVGDFVQTSLNFNTITDNPVKNVFYLDFAGSNGQILQIFNSIIHNSGAQLIEFDSGEASHTVNINCSILHELTGANVEANGTIVADPMFFGNGNYHLKQESVAISPDCSNVSSPIYSDVRGENRLQGLFADIGAYEAKTTDENIFSNSFE